MAAEKIQQDCRKQPIVALFAFVKDGAAGKHIAK
jgi:hypothetical protein